MLNRELKKMALEIHEKAKNRYNETYDTTMKLCQALYDARRDSLGLIQNIESFWSTASQIRRRSLRARLQKSARSVQASAAQRNSRKKHRASW